MTSTLTIEGLRVEVAGKEVLKGFDLFMSTGEVHVIMGPNGSGKSTLAHALSGHPGYTVLSGSVRIDDVELLNLSPTERARHGLLLAMQQPLEVPGVRPFDLLVAAGVDPTNLRGPRPVRQRRPFGRRTKARRDRAVRIAASEVRRARRDRLRTRRRRARCRGATFVTGEQ